MVHRSRKKELRDRYDVNDEFCGRAATRLVMPKVLKEPDGRRAAPTTAGRAFLSFADAALRLAVALTCGKGAAIAEAKAAIGKKKLWAQRGAPDDLLPAKRIATIDDWKQAGARVAVAADEQDAIRQRSSEGEWREFAKGACVGQAALGHRLSKQKRQLWSEEPPDFALEEETFDEAFGEERVPAASLRGPDPRAESGLRKWAELWAAGPGEAATPAAPSTEEEDGVAEDNARRPGRRGEFLQSEYGLGD